MKGSSFLRKRSEAWADDTSLHCTGMPFTAALGCALGVQVFGPSGCCPLPSASLGQCQYAPDLG